MESSGNFTNIAGFGDVTLLSNLLFGIGYGIIILVTIVSNSLIILAYLTNVSVRKRVCNIYVVSLALGDLMTGALVMLFYYVARLRHLTANDSAWNNSCRVWLTLKFIAINASFYSVFLISYDRYQLVTDTFNYKSYASRRVAFMRVLGIWTWCILYNVVYIVVSHNNPRWNDLSHLTCGPVLSSDSLVFQICIFLEPLLLFTALVVVNSLMFIKMYYGSKITVRKNTSKRLNNSRRAEVVDSDLMSNLPEQEVNGEEEDDNNGNHNSNNRQNNGNKDNGRNSYNNNNNDSLKRLFTKPQLRKYKSWIVSLSRNGREESIDTVRRRKTAITLSLLVVTFVICWFPFFSYVILEYYDVIEMSKQVMEVITNILLLNSTLNPFLYGLRNARINRAVKLLIFRQERRKTSDVIQVNEIRK